MLPSKIQEEQCRPDTLQHGCTQRVRALREQSMHTKPRVCMERAAIITKVYRQYEGKVSVPKLRALALLHYMQERSLYLGDGELIVGEKSASPQSAPTFPEICCHSLEDMEIMRRRELISFDSTREDRDFQRDEIIPFWQERSIRSKLFSLMAPEWKDAYQAGIFTEFMEQRGPGHTVGSGKIYEKGFHIYSQSSGKE